jgi:hypothetical protein
MKEIPNAMVGGRDGTQRISWVQQLVQQKIGHSGTFSILVFNSAEAGRQPLKLKLKPPTTPSKSLSIGKVG